MAATRSKVTAWPGSSTMTRSEGVSQVARTRSMPSSAPPVTMRLVASMPSAASCPAASRRSHRGRADAELVSQVADRGKPVARVQLPVPDARLHAGRYLLCGTALNAISYQYVHSLYCNILSGAAEPASG